MIYLCHLLGKPVRGADGQKVGSLQDLFIPIGTAHPNVMSLLMKRRQGMKRIPWPRVRSVTEEGVDLDVAVDDLPDFVEDDQEIALREDLLDKQIVDTDGRRVVRVNDLQLLRSGEQIFVFGVDISTLGLLRRLGWEGAAERVMRLFNVPLARSVIPWDYVEPLDVRDFGQIRLTISHRKLTELHPADLAEILTAVHGREREALFASLNAETAAETLQEMEEDVQVSLFKTLSDEQASSVLEEMDPDEAADLIAELPPERVQALLSLMEAEDAAEVQELMSYEPDSAGGVMTTEFIGIPGRLTSQETIEKLRELAPDAETIYYLYILDEGERLLGVLSLRDLVVSPPDTQIAEITNANVVKVKVSDSIEEVRDTINKYDLLAIPVVDAENVMRGIVTVDDVMDRMMPATWKRKFPRIF